MINNWLSLIFALAAPLLLWPIELLLPYPYLLEEFAKGLLIYSLPPSSSLPRRLLLAAAIGTAFSLSESLLYLFNLIAIGSPSLFLLRLTLTLPLHVSTTLILALVSFRRPRFTFLGLPPAILLHFLFNRYLSAAF